MSRAHTTTKTTANGTREKKRPATPHVLDEPAQQPQDDILLEWEATEYVPKRRWWWYLALGFLTFEATLILYAYGNWSAALL